MRTLRGMSYLLCLTRFALCDLCIGDDAAVGLPMLLSLKDASLNVSYTLVLKKTDVSNIQVEKLGRPHRSHPGT